MATCLLPKLANELLKRVKSGEINPDMLRSLDSPERRAYLEKFLDLESAKTVNIALEGGLTKQNWKKGVINAIKKVSGMKPESQRDIISRVERMDDLLNPKTDGLFYQDLVSKRLGMPGELTMKQSQELSDFGSEVMRAKVGMTERRNPLGKKTAGEEIYGKAVVKFSNYFNSLKNEELTFKELGKMFVTPSKMGKAVVEVAGISKSAKATLDNSAIFAQGWRFMTTDTKIWAKNAIQSFRDIIGVFGGKAVMDEVKSDIISNPYYDLMKKEKLDIFNLEEALPAPILGRIPIFGRVYNAVETAFTAFLYRTRADVFVKHVELLSEVEGAEITGLGRYINQLSGRGQLGVFEPTGKVVNNLFFSPKRIVSHFQVMTTALVKSDKYSSYVRKLAAVNLVKMIGVTAGILAIAKALQPDSVDSDPRSADFGNIKIGDTRFNVTGGMNSIFILAARILTFSSKSSTTGKITKLNSGEYGSQTVIDVLTNFTLNKLSPAASILKDIAKGQDFSGNKLTIAGEAYNMFVPLPIVTFIELQQNPNSANILLATILDALGIVANTYSANSNWSTSSSKELMGFKTKVGDAKFKEANNKYNQLLNEWYAGIKDNSEFNKLGTDVKTKVISDKKDKLKDQVLLSYGYKYKKAPSKPTPKF